MVVLLLGINAPSASAQELPLEYQVKSGFLFNFAKFVEWPAGALPEGEPLRLGIIGSDEILAGMAVALQDKVVAGHRIEVTRIDPAAPCDTAPNILFVQRNTQISPADAATLFPTSPVLIVGETPGFAAGGGTIGFIFRGDTLRFQVNIGAANQSNLRLSSQLANLAEIVRSR